MSTARSLLRSFFVAAPLILGLGACDDPFAGQFDPLMALDTVTIAAPLPANALLPSALDVTAIGQVIQGGRFPERVADANQGWDLAVRVQGGQLVLLPSPAFGFQNRAGITAPLQGQTFEAVRDLPGGARFATDSARVVQVGAVYVVRSREFSAGFAGRCQQYAKIQPLAADVAAGTVRLQIATNERCFDTRLVAAGS